MIGSKRSSGTKAGFALHADTKIKGGLQAFSLALSDLEQKQMLLTKQMYVRVVAKQLAVTNPDFVSFQTNVNKFTKLVEKKAMKKYCILGMDNESMFMIKKSLFTGLLYCDKFSLVDKGKKIFTV